VLAGAALAVALCTAMSAGAPSAADAQGTWRTDRSGRRITTQSGGEVDSLTLAAIADSLAVAVRSTPVRPTVPPPIRFRSAADSVAHETTSAAAERDARLRVVVSLADRELWVVDGPADTLLVAHVAIGVDTSISYAGRTFRFETPRGRRNVLRKERNPVWVPPDWHYVEVAAKRGLKLAYLRPNRPVSLLDGSRLVVRNRHAGVIGRDGRFTALPDDEEIVFDGTLFVPPLGSENRRIKGELGRFKLDLGNGYLLHGTPYESTVGTAATHGCIRLYDEDIEWLYQNVPAGTPVYII
jgi:hypothetical protein